MDHQVFYNKYIIETNKKQILLMLLEALNLKFLSILSKKNMQLNEEYKIKFSFSEITKQ